MRAPWHLLRLPHNARLPGCLATFLPFLYFFQDLRRTLQVQRSERAGALCCLCSLPLLPLARQTVGGEEKGGAGLVCCLALSLLRPLILSPSRSAFPYPTV